MLTEIMRLAAQTELVQQQIKFGGKFPGAMKKAHFTAFQRTRVGITGFTRC